MEARSEESLTDMADTKQGRKPTYDIMVKKAIAGLQSKRGSSTKAITQFVSSHFNVEGAKSKKSITTALKRMVAKGLILKGAGNSFKLTRKGRKMRRVRGRKRRSRKGRKGRKGRKRRRRSRKGRKGRKGRRRRRRRGRKAKKGRKTRRRRRRRGRKAKKAGKRRSRRGRSRRRRR